MLRVWAGMGQEGFIYPAWSQWWSRTALDTGGEILLLLFAHISSSHFQFIYYVHLFCTFFPFIYFTLSYLTYYVDDAFIYYAQLLY